MKVKSQWDFGELFGSDSLRRVWTVSELTSTIKQLLERQVGQVWVSGEVTNLRQQSSGHIYFTLKDATAQLNCVLFRGEARAHRDLLQDGQKVLLQGDLTVYEPRGQYQLRVTAIELQGLGALQLAFERLKQKLQAEGLFAQERKRPIPRFPRRIGVVTSPTGAALRDVIHVVQRRNPALELVLAPCRVQGSGAAEAIAQAIRQLNRLALGAGEMLEDVKTPKSDSQVIPLDAILMTRGGGSLEDLWAFNEEIVARAIFESQLPVVSAVGHEIDFTISDFVADLRAATPSAAAELLTEGVFASRAFVFETPNYMRQLIRRRLEQDKQRLGQTQGRLTRVHPRRLINERWQRLDDVQTELARAARGNWTEAQRRWITACQRLGRVRLSQLLARRGDHFQTAHDALHERIRQRIQDLQNRWTRAHTKLMLLSPLNVLARGYSITSDAQTGQVIRQAEEVHPGQKIKTRLKNGAIRSTVEDPDV
jgi:exodeoxyribonuclease VII large subunit